MLTNIFLIQTPDLDFIDFRDAYELSLNVPRFPGSKVIVRTDWKCETDGIEMHRSYTAYAEDLLDVKYLHAHLRHQDMLNVRSVHNLAIQMSPTAREERVRVMNKEEADALIEELAEIEGEKVIMIAPLIEKFNLEDTHRAAKDTEDWSLVAASEIGSEVIAQFFAFYSPRAKQFFYGSHIGGDDTWFERYPSDQGLEIGTRDDLIRAWGKHCDTAKARMVPGDFSFKNYTETLTEIMRFDPAKRVNVAKMLEDMNRLVAL